MRAWRAEGNKAGPVLCERVFVPCGARGLFFIFVWAACAAGGRWGPVRGCQTQSFWRGPLCTPPGRPRWACRTSSLPRVSLQGPSISHHSTRAARPLLRELPRSARRSPCAPRNASVRFCVEWEIRACLVGWRNAENSDLGMVFLLRSKNSRLSMPPQKSAKQTKHITCTVSQAGSVLLPGAVP